MEHDAIINYEIIWTCVYIQTNLVIKFWFSISNSKINGHIHNINIKKQWYSWIVHMFYEISNMKLIEKLYDI